MRRMKIAQIIALIATVVSIVGVVMKVKNAGGYLGAEKVILLGFTLGLVSFVFGGLGEALKMVWKIGTTGWFILPIPFNLVSLYITAVIALLVTVCFPIIPVRTAYMKKLQSGAY